MSIKKAFFLVNDLQDHYWNLEPSLIIANVLRNEGWEIGFGIHRTEVLMDMSHIYDIYFLPFKSPLSWKSFFRKSALEYRFSDLRKIELPIFWVYDSIKFRILEEGYLTFKIVQSQFRKIVQTVKKWKPDLLIGAEHFLTRFVGKKLNLPVIQLVKRNAFPGHSSKIKTSNSLEPKTTMDILQVFEQVFNITGGSAVIDVHQMLLGDGYIIPGTPDFQPVVTNDPYLFIGIHKEINWDERLLRYDKKKRNNKIFINFQKISKPLNYKAYYDLLFSVVHQINSQFIVSDPTGIVSRNYLRENYSNVSIMKWINNPLVFPYIDLVIHAGDDKNLYDYSLSSAKVIVLEYTQVVKS